MVNHGNAKVKVKSSTLSLIQYAIISNSCSAAKLCSKPQNFILNSSGDLKVSKDTKYVGEMCLK